MTNNPKTCAYCGKVGPLTHEHLFPDWLSRRTPRRENNLQYLQRAQKFVDAELTIKDVCIECNNVLLSPLDGYMCQLYDEYFQHFIRRGETVRFRYRFDELARWLLKTIYNSARVTNSEPYLFAKWAKYMLHGRGRPEGLTILIRLVIPHKVDPADAKLLPESVQKAGEIVPYMVRIAKHASPLLVRYEQILTLYRIVALNSYYFHVLIPGQDQYSRSAWRRIMRQFQQEVVPQAYRLKPESNEIRLTASRFDFVDVFGPSILANFDLYNSEFGIQTE